MSIENAILGLLSWRSLSGYDLKKIFEDSPILYWSGNNNEIYRSLLKLHHTGLVAYQYQPQENLPARKLYTLTPSGRAELEKWAAATPQLPQLRHSLFIQLAWGDLLEKQVLDRLLETYEDELMTQLILARGQSQRSHDPTGLASRLNFLNPRHARSPREALLWQSIQAYWEKFYETELEWIGRLRLELTNLDGTNDPT